MNNLITLDSLLLGLDDSKFASFHDAEMLNIEIDYKLKTLKATFSLFVGDPDSINEKEKEKTKIGVLSLSGLHL